MSVSLRRFILAVSYGISLLGFSVAARAGEDWPPIAPEELKMSSEPKAPGAMAVYLYRQVDRDDFENREVQYARIKVFSEEGRKYGDIEIPFIQGLGEIRNIQARTIHADGTIVDFDGKVYEKTVIKARGLKYLAKTFTMSDVQTGSIIEYRYTRILPSGWIYDSQWLLSEELFTKHAKFSLRQNEEYALQWSWPNGLPPGTNTPLMDHHVVRLETQDIPAFQIEDYMPPEEDMKYRIDFRYTRSHETDPEKFWKEESKRLALGVEHFIDRRKGLDEAVAQIITPADTSQQKLEKIYVRCQKIRNLSFEHEKTQQETNREKLKGIQNVEDVWKRGYSGKFDITWLFLALARAAGFDATPVLIATREEHFFNPKLMNPDYLNTNVVLVKLDGKDLYLDPGVPFAPMGVLPWNETEVPGLRLSKDGGRWGRTAGLDPSLSGTHRTASLHLDETGTLEGTATITYRGITALARRLDEYQEDGQERKKFLEDEIKSSVPVSMEAELTNKPDWGSASPELVAEFHIKVENWASTAGHRTFFPAALFGGGEKHLFEHENRVHPIYFDFPSTDEDDVVITPPTGSKIANLPQPKDVDLKACAYGIATDGKDGAVRVHRRLMQNMPMVEVKYYATLRNFYQTVRSGDEQQITLSSIAGPH